MSHRGGSRRRLAVWWALGALILTFVFAAFWSAPATDAQDGSTPEAESSPESATPLALTPEETRFARLGGNLADVLAAYGAPDWTDEGLAGYNALSLGGIETITMVYYDAQERVRSYLLVYLEEPAALQDPESVAAVVAEVAPRDGVCDATPMTDSNLGDEVYACSSDALQGVFGPYDLLAFDVFGEDGTYNYSVNPTDDDQFFEIAVRLGTEGPPEPATPVPTPSPQPPAPLDERYPPVENAAALIDGSVEMGTPLSVTGTVLDIRLADTGTTLILDVRAEDGASVIIAAENQDDLAGIFVGEIWTVHGVYAGYECDDVGNCTATIYVMSLA
ncbi:MAG: hypothetical protein AB7G88_07630 [Thermomicrobiales bacterium]